MSELTSDVNAAGIVDRLAEQRKPDGSLPASAAEADARVDDYLSTRRQDPDPIHGKLLAAILRDETDVEHASHSDHGDRVSVRSHPEELRRVHYLAGEFGFVVEELSGKDSTVTVTLVRDPHAPERNQRGRDWKERAAELHTHGIPEVRSRVVALIERGETHTSVAETLGFNNRSNVAAHVDDYREQRENVDWLARNAPQI